MGGDTTLNAEFGILLVSVVRAITHLHTSFSWDSPMRPERLVEILTELDIGLALVTDHDSFEGSLEVARIAAGKVIVPISAEIRTDQGDLIAVFEPGTEPPPVSELKEWQRAVPFVRGNGGLVWFPHPYRSHPTPELLAPEVDVIEVFNARCSQGQDDRATQLAIDLAIHPGFGSDAHLKREVPSVIVEYDASEEAPVRDILMSPLQPIQAIRNPKSTKMLAEVVNGVKRKRPALAAYFGARYVRHRIGEATRR